MIKACNGEGGSSSRDTDSEVGVRFVVPCKLVKNKAVEEAMVLKGSVVCFGD
jgi:hypothetical protein